MTEPPPVALPHRLIKLETALGGGFKSIRIIDAANATVTTYRRVGDENHAPGWTVEEGQDEGAGS